MSLIVYFTEKEVSKRFRVSTDEFWKALPSCTISSWVFVDWLFESFKKAVSYQSVEVVKISKYSW